MSFDNRDHMIDKESARSNMTLKKPTLADRVKNIDGLKVGGKSRARVSKSDHNLYDNIVNGEYTLDDEHNPSEIEIETQPSFRLDRYNIALLFFLYVLQGVPLGLSAAVPMLLQNRGISYTEQAQFSLVLWPFSLKLLWAPIVDYLYIKEWGRRKTWLIPTQYLLAVFMMVLAVQIDDWISQKQPNIRLITLFFFILNFLAATQDIAVDGWALTMLKRCNVGYSSTCNSVGQTVGYFLGYVLFVSLESAEFCNTYLRSEAKKEGIITLKMYLLFWSFVFLIATTAIAFFKREEQPGERRVPQLLHPSSSLQITVDHHSPNVEHVPKDIKESYSILLSIIKLKPVYQLAILLLTAKIGFAACDGVTHLKLMEAGIPKEKMAIMAIPIVPLQMMLPLIISRYTTGRKPMNVYLTAYPYRLCMNIIIAVIVWLTPSIIGSNKSVPQYYYAMLIIVYCIEQVTVYSMFVATMAFFARISDPSIGGTYMTLLNTLSNLGSSWTTTTALWMVDFLTYKSCSNGKFNCNSPDTVKACTNAKGKCLTSLDGYFIESIVCTVFGIVWFLRARKKILHMQALGNSAWLKEWRTPNSHRDR